MCLHCSMEEDGILEHTYVKRHLCTLDVVQCRHTPHNTIKHTHAKI